MPATDESVFSIPDEDWSQSAENASDLMEADTITTMVASPLFEVQGFSTIIGQIFTERLATGWNACSQSGEDPCDCPAVWTPIT